MSTDQPVSDAQLRALLAGSLPEDDVGHLEGLLEADPGLRERLETLAGTSEFDSEIAPGACDADATSPTPEAEAEDLSDIIGALKADAETRPPSTTPTLVASILGPPHDADAIGSLGPYEVEGHLATGGMGVVYKARDPQLKRQVAIKVLSPHFAGHAEAVQRFLREATAAAAIEHPHVLPIHAIDTESAELPFFVLRYVDGPSVEKLIAERKGPLEFEQVLTIAKAVSSALAAAHAKDLTHRDIKPSNILLERAHDDASRESQSIYLTDFGLARIGDDSALTRPGAYLGTPQFSSPEQARGEACDHRSDLFSLGAVLYAMATGAAPFSREDNSLTSVVYRVVHEAHPPAQSANPALPAWFSELIDRLLAKDPAQRPASAKDVLGCLEAESLDALSERTQQLKPGKALAAAGLLLALVATGLLVIMKPFGAKDAGDTTDPTPAAPGSPSAGGSEIVVIGADGSRENFGALAEAVSAAGDGSVIEIAHTGELLSAPIVVPDNSAITIRAAVGHLPILSTDDLHEPVLTSSSDLVLEGLTIRGERPTQQSPPVIKILHGKFRASGCRLETPSNIAPRKRTFTLHLALIEISGTPRLQIENCELVGAGSGGIRYMGTAEIEQPVIEIRNSLIVAYSGLELHGAASGDGAIEVTLERNFMVGRRPLVFFGAGGAFPVRIGVSESLFSSDTTIVGTPLRIRDLFENVAWIGENNVYSALALIQSGDRARGPGARSLTTMEQFGTLFEGDSGSEKRDLAYRKHVGQYLLEPVKIRAVILKEVPPPEDPLPTTGPDVDRIGPGDPYHLWRADQPR